MLAFEELPICVDFAMMMTEERERARERKESGGGV
jgi:hypothetical protein